MRSQILKIAKKISSQHSCAVPGLHCHHQAGHSDLIPVIHAGQHWDEAVEEALVCALRSVSLLLQR